MRGGNGDRTTKTTKKMTKPRTCQDGENQTSFEENLDAGGGATGGLPESKAGDTMLKRALSPTEADGGAASNGGQWTSDLPSPLLNQQLWEKREREQAQELQWRNLKHQVGQFQQRIQLDHLERGLVGANSPIGNAAPPPCDSRERQPSLAAGSLGAPTDLRERQLLTAAGSLEYSVHLRERQLSIAAGSLGDPDDEQFRVLNAELQTWTQEHSPATSSAAAELSEVKEGVVFLRAECVWFSSVIL